MESDEDLKKRLREVLKNAAATWARGKTPKRDRPIISSEMDKFYVYGCPVMLLKDAFARINAPNEKAAKKVEQYLRDEGFMPEPKREGDEWK